MAGRSRHCALRGAVAVSGPTFFCSFRHLETMVRLVMLEWRFVLLQDDDVAIVWDVIHNQQITERALTVEFVASCPQMGTNGPSTEWLGLTVLGYFGFCLLSLPCLLSSVFLSVLVSGAATPR